MESTPAQTESLADQGISGESEGSPQAQRASWLNEGTETGFLGPGLAMVGQPEAQSPSRAQAQAKESRLSSWHDKAEVKRLVRILEDVDVEDVLDATVASETVAKLIGDLWDEVEEDSCREELLALIEMSLSTWGDLSTRLQLRALQQAAEYLRLGTVTEEHVNSLRSTCIDAGYRPVGILGSVSNEDNDDGQ